MSAAPMLDNAFLPYGRQVIDDEDIAAVSAILRGEFLTTGPAVDVFEKAIASATNAPFAVACSSGTAALHLATLALELGAGNTVVVPAVTFLATANAATYVGADVVFADVDPDTGLMEARHLEAAIDAAGQPVAAVIPVHMAGQCADLAAIRRVADAAGARVVEDACHALGTIHRDSPVGACAYSDLATFSFHPVKTVACGEGGAVTTGNTALYERLCRLRNHGIERVPDNFANKTLSEYNGTVNPWYYEMAEPGFNYRLSDIHAALGASQLAKLDRNVTRRRVLVDRYVSALTPLAPTVRALPHTSHTRSAWHLMVALVDFSEAGVDRATVMARLREAGIGTQVHYIPVPWQPFYGSRSGADFPGAKAYYDRCLSLPLFPAMDDADVDRVVDALAVSLEA